MRRLTRFESVPVDCLLGYPKFVSTISACTSVRTGLVPSIEQVTTEPLAPRGLPLSMYSEGLSTSAEHVFRGIEHFDKSLSSHLKDADLIS